jgi:hypothetical protein
MATTRIIENRRDKAGNPDLQNHAAGSPVPLTALGFFLTAVPIVNDC